MACTAQQREKEGATGSRFLSHWWIARQSRERHDLYQSAGRRAPTVRAVGMSITRAYGVVCDPMK